MFFVDTKTSFLLFDKVRTNASTHTNYLILIFLKSVCCKTMSATKKRELYSPHLNCQSFFSIFPAVQLAGQLKKMCILQPIRLSSTGSFSRHQKSMAKLLIPWQIFFSLLGKYAHYLCLSLGFGLQLSHYPSSLRLA